MIEVASRFDEPHLISWPNQDRFGVPDLLHPDLKALAADLNGIEGADSCLIKTPQQLLSLRVKTIIGQKQIYTMSSVVQEDGDVIASVGGFLFDSELSREIYGSHYGDVVSDPQYKRKGLATLMRTVVEHTNGVLTEEFTNGSDRFILLLRRGYVPDEELSEAETNMIQQSMKTGEVQNFTRRMDMTFNPTKAYPLWNKLTLAS